MSDRARILIITVVKKGLGDIVIELYKSRSRGCDYSVWAWNRYS